MKTDVALKALGALAQVHRLSAFRLLVQAGQAGLAAGDLAVQLGISPAALSFHVKELANAGLVGSRQEGRFVYYFAHYDSMTDLIGFLTENCCAGGGCAAVPASPRRRRA